MGTLSRRLPAPPAALLCALPTLALVVLAWHRRWLSDDGFINLRVVANLRDGLGPVFNAGERVEAYTSPLWLALLWLGDLLTPGVSLEHVAVGLGLACSAAGLAAATWAAWRLWALAGDGPAVPLGALVVAGAVPFWDFATSGLDSSLALAWLGVAFLGLTARRAGAGHAAVLAALIGLGPLVRPDLSLFAAGFLGALLWRERAAGARRAATVVLCTLALPAAYELFRMGYFATLVPNTAIAKSAGAADWDRGWTYAGDFVTSLWLWAPLAGLATALAVLLRALRAHRDAVVLVVVTEACALLHALYVVRLGGDWMQARMLLPSTFAIALPVMVVRLRAVLVPAVVVVAAWTVVAAAGLRLDERRTPYAIEDVRQSFVDATARPNPVAVGDFARVPWEALGADMRRRAERRREVVLGTLGLPGPTAPAAAGLRTPVVFHYYSIGIVGFAAGPRVYLADVFGLADPVGARLPVTDPRRAGHEKLLTPEWVLGRFGAPGATVAGVDPGAVRAARRALSCGPLRRLRRATAEPLSWGRFWGNVHDAWRLRSLRIPQDPREAQARWCPAARRG
jgi:arabinofuranosyltransferase